MTIHPKLIHHLPILVRDWKVPDRQLGSLIDRNIRVQGDILPHPGHSGNMAIQLLFISIILVESLLDVGHPLKILGSVRSIDGGKPVQH